MDITTIGLFEGIGGFLIAASRVGGFKWLESVEIDPDAQQVLRTHYDHPIHSDIRTYNPEAGAANCIVGGFPCTNTSTAGDRTGIHGRESSLWWEMHRIINQVRPQFVVIENPEGLRHRGLNEVIHSLTACGYVGEWQCVSAAHVGAPHRRDRLFIIAYPEFLFSNREQPTSWHDQIRGMVQEQRDNSAFPRFERSNDGVLRVLRVRAD